MDFKVEQDSMGKIAVAADKLWGAQTQRSFENFKIGENKMPMEIIYALALLKKACAEANRSLKPDKMTEQKKEAITKVCDYILSGKLNEHFPLVVFQTGSGTQSNMNVNEVVANKANLDLGQKLVHPNDDVNMSQSSNDTFPSAMHIAAVLCIKNKVLPALNSLVLQLGRLEEQNKGIIKIGRTHLQDATPIAFSQEISGWRASLERDRQMIEQSLNALYPLAIGGTAVGTGLNCPDGFDKLVCEKLREYTGFAFEPSDNKFHSLTSRDEFVFAHGALKALAADLMKIANDIRLLASGPRCGLSEIFIPENEPGSSIMPGKVNPTQCEAVTQVAVAVMGNDAALGFAASQGNFELNVFLPVIAQSFLSSAKLLADAMQSFEKNCVSGIRANKEKMQQNLERSLMLVTALNPKIGYEKAAQVAKKAFSENISLKEACLALELLTEVEFDTLTDPYKMI